MILGIGPYPSPGFKNWTIGDAPFVGGAMGILSIFMVAGFSFQGTEIIGIAAGESENPEKNIPRAVRTILAYSAFLSGILHCYRFPDSIY